ncbi:MAG: hypothetical protein R3E79_10085 [Caldilineaceae bacterium]
MVVLVPLLFNSVGERFTANARWTLLDHVQLQEELAALVGRNVDLVGKRGIQQSCNPICR